MKLKFNPSYVLMTFIAVCVWAGASAQTAGNSGTKPVGDNRNLVRVEQGEKQTGEKKILTGATELQSVRPRPNNGSSTNTEGAAQVPTTIVRRQKQ